MKTKMKCRNSINFNKYLKNILGVSLTVPITCARSALVQGLRALSFRRMDEILVAPYMCHAVLTALSRISFPAMMVSSRTKAILVLHQFGFPQRLDLIEKKAKEKNWFIVGNCVHSFSSFYHGRNILEWGDFSIVSFSKIFSCVLGGAIVSKNKSFMNAVQSNINLLNTKDEAWAEKAYKVLNRNQQNIFRNVSIFEIAEVYGFLPEIASVPLKVQEILIEKWKFFKKHRDRQKNIWEIVRDFFPHLVPYCPECDVVPWKIPIRANLSQINRIVSRVNKKTGISLPILHFDFERNMLKPNYQPAFVIDCSGFLSRQQVIMICNELKSLGLK